MVWWGDRPTQVHLRFIKYVPSLICYSSSVLKFSSNEHVFERLCFFCTTRLVVAEDNVKFWLVLY